MLRPPVCIAESIDRNLRLCPYLPLIQIADMIDVRNPPVLLRQGSIYNFDHFMQIIIHCAPTFPGQTDAAHLSVMFQALFHQADLRRPLPVSAFRKPFQIPDLFLIGLK